MKRIFNLPIFVLFFVLTVVAAFAQRPTTLTEPCPTGVASNRNQIRLFNGNVELNPCPGKKVLINGVPLGSGGGLDSIFLFSSPAAGQVPLYNGTNFINSFLSASNITSGIFSPARLGSGTANSSAYLRGDGVWTGLNWGVIGGTLSNQTDLNNALNARLLKSNNLSDLSNPSLARANLGLSTVAASGSYNDLSNKPTLDSLLPSQSGNSGKFLTTNGMTASWATISGGGSVSLPLNQIAFGTGGGITTSSRFKFYETSLGASIELSNADASGYAGFELRAQDASTWKTFFGYGNTDNRFRFNTNGIPIDFKISGTNAFTVNTNRTVTFSADITVPDDEYSEDWDDNFEVPTKNAVRDKIAALGAGGGTTVNVSGGNIVSLSEEITSQGSFANALSHLCGLPTNTTVLHDTTVTINGNYTVCKKVKFKPINGAVFLESGTGTITFAGKGLEDESATGTEVIFENFEPGDITWSSDTLGNYPTAISTEIFNTNNNSETDRAKSVTLAIPANATLWINVYPRVQDSPVFYRDRHSVRMMGGIAGGVHGNTFNEGYWETTQSIFDGMPHTLGSNTEFTCENPGVVVKQSTVNYSPRIVQTRSLAVNVKIHGCTFEGNGTTLWAGAETAVSLVNAVGSEISGNRFLAITAYNAFIINNANIEEPNKWNKITNNYFEAYATQIFGSTDGQWVEITYNHVNLLGWNLDVACALIDIEPNDLYTKLFNLNISYNYFELRGMSGNVSIRAIQVQAAHSDGVEGLEVNFNVMVGGEHYGSQHSKITAAIQIDGADGCQVMGNRTQGMGFYSIVLAQSRRCVVTENRASNGGMSIILNGTGETTVEKNYAWRTNSGLTEVTAISESQFYHPIQTTGTPGTLIGDVYGSLGNAGRIHKHYKEMTARINGQRRKIATVTVAEPHSSLTFDSSVGTLSTQTITSADVNSTTNVIAENSHGWNTGAALLYLTNGTPVAGLTQAAYYYVIKVDNNSYKLASSYRNARAGTAIDLSGAAGSGTHTIHPVMELVSQGNRFGVNSGFETYTLEDFSDSEVLDANGDGLLEDAADFGIVNAIEIYPNTSLGASYSSGGTVKGSNVGFGDGAATTLGTFGTVTANQWNRLAFENATFYKFVWLQGDNGGYFGIPEIRFLHSKRQLNYTAIYASTSNGTDIVDRAFDGDTATVWATGCCAGGSIGVQIKTAKDNTSERTTTNYTFSARDIGNEVRACNALPSTYYVNTTTALGIENYRDFDVEVLNACAGEIAFEAAPDSGVTLLNNVGTLAEGKRVKIVAIANNKIQLSWDN